jgi:Uma2 family endonuclease
MSGSLVEFDEYMHSSYEYDKEWENGTVVERNGGEFPHSYTLALLCEALSSARSEFIPLISVRVQTSSTSIRVPDFVLLRCQAPRERIIAHAPLLVVEVKAPEDKLAKLSEKAGEYRVFGIAHVWVIDPYARVAYRGISNGLELVRSGELAIPGTPIRVVPQEIFAELDRV